MVRGGARRRRRESSWTRSTLSSSPRRGVRPPAAGRAAHPRARASRGTGPRNLPPHERGSQAAHCPRELGRGQEGRLRLVGVAGSALRRRRARAAARSGAGRPGAVGHERLDRHPVKACRLLVRQEANRAGAGPVCVGHGLVAAGGGGGLEEMVRELSEMTVKVGGVAGSRGFRRPADGAVRGDFSSDDGRQRPGSGRGRIACGRSRREPPRRRATSIASSSSSRMASRSSPPTPASASRSNSRPSTEARVRRRLHPSERWRRRRPITSLTLWGMASGAVAGSTRRLLRSQQPQDLADEQWIAFGLGMHTAAQVACGRSRSSQLDETIDVARSEPGERERSRDGLASQFRERRPSGSARVGSTSRYAPTISRRLVTELSSDEPQQ